MPDPLPELLPIMEHHQRVHVFTQTVRRNQGSIHPTPTRMGTSRLRRVGEVDPQQASLCHRICSEPESADARPTKGPLEGSVRGVHRNARISEVGHNYRVGRKVCDCTDRLKLAGTFSTATESGLHLSIGGKHVHSLPLLVRHHRTSIGQ